MKEKKWFQSMGVWFWILVALLVLCGILGNWIDGASVAGGYLLMYVVIPYFVIWMVVSTIHQIKKEKAADAEKISNKKG